jgi:hypothetical protein
MPSGDLSSRGIRAPATPAWCCGLLSAGELSWVVERVTGGLDGWRISGVPALTASKRKEKKGLVVGRSSMSLSYLLCTISTPITPSRYGNLLDSGNVGLFPRSFPSFGVSFVLLSFSFGWSLHEIIQQTKSTTGQRGSEAKRHSPALRNGVCVACGADRPKSETPCLFFFGPVPDRSWLMSTR